VPTVALVLVSMGKRVSVVLAVVEIYFALSYSEEHFAFIFITRTDLEQSSIE